VSKLIYTDVPTICKYAGSKQNLESGKIGYANQIYRMGCFSKAGNSKGAAFENDILLLQRSNKELQSSKKSLQKISMICSQL
jgi:hypothetical protein